jgi:hypothetical protein
VRDLIFAQFLKRLVRSAPRGDNGHDTIVHSALRTVENNGVPSWRVRSMPETFDCCGGKFFHKLHTVILRRVSEVSSHGRPITKSVGL